MRKSLAITLVALSFASTASLAEAQSAPRGRMERNAPGRSLEGRGARDGLFRGITLSAAEQAKLTEVRARFAGEARELRTSLQPAMQEMRAARQKGDTAAVRAAFERTRPQREKLRQLAERQRTEVRSVLSAENQRRFDANVQELKQRRAEGRRDREGRDGRGPARGPRGANRPSR